MEQINNEKQNKSQRVDFKGYKVNNTNNLLKIEDYKLSDVLKKNFGYLSKNKVDYLKGFVNKSISCNIEISNVFEKIKKPLKVLLDNGVLSSDDCYVLEIMCDALIDFTINVISSDKDLIMTLRINL